MLIISPYRCKHAEDPSCDCDSHVTYSSRTSNPTRAEIIARTARIRAAWTAEEEHDRRATGRAIGFELPSLDVPPAAKRIADDELEYPMPECRRYLQRKTRQTA